MASALVVLTQPASRARALAARLRDAGIEVAEWPMTVVEGIPGIDWTAVRATVAHCRWALFPSPGAIDVTMSAWARDGIEWPAGTGIGLIGPGSREALEGWREAVPGLARATVVEPRATPHDADALLARAEFAALEGLEVAVLRRADGREAWLDALRARGATLHAITAYAARDATLPTQARPLIEARAACDARVIWSIASGDAGRRLAHWVTGLDRARWAFDQPALTQHPRIAEVLRAHGWRRVERHRPGADGLIAAIESARIP